jgi:hypothetical protein
MVGLALLVLVGACSAPGIGGAPAHSPSPHASGSPTPSGAPTTAPPPATATPGGSPSSVASCTQPIPASANLVLGTLTGSTTVVLRDITNLASARTLCTFSGSLAPRFATASVVGYAPGPNSDAPGQIIRLDLAASWATVSASWPSGALGSGTFDWSPDGSALTYVAGASTGPVWHLVSHGRDLVLSNLSLPAPFGRGVSQEDDDFMLAFSPDGLYVALVQTFATAGTGESAPVQVRRASDGALVYSAASGTMAVWASVPSRLFFRSAAGVLSRWDPSSGVSVMQSSLKWVRPHGSSDGRWVAYTQFDSAGHPTVHLYGVQGNSLGPSPIGLRSGALFLNNNLVWYQEEAACDCGLSQSKLTGRTFLYDIGGSSESASRISGVFDAWPRVAAPPGLS